jgi:CRISPR/Cas system CSM-associated protein Csm4 (group 5 of RAMP superfamily)
MTAVIERQSFQVKLGSKWEDMELGISNLANLAANVMSAKGPDLQKIHNIIAQFHGVTKAQDPTLYALENIYYTLESVDDDVLKISYRFRAVFGSLKDREKAEKARIKHAAKEAKTKSSWPAPNVVKEDREISGLITLMPGN